MSASDEILHTIFVHWGPDAARKHSNLVGPVSLTPAAEPEDHHGAPVREYNEETYGVENF